MNAQATVLVDSGPRSLSLIYSDYHKELRIYAAHRLNLSTPEAEDVVQLAFTRFAATFEEKPIDNVRAFLYRAVHNAAVDHIRRTQVREGYAHSVQHFEDREEDKAGPERSAISKQFLEIITGALWSMPSKRRKLLLMNRIEGLSYAEIARREQLSETVVRKHVAKALLGCQGALRQRGEEI